MRKDERQDVMAIVLAAGASRRLGEPKQLVNYKGKPLIRHSVDNCLEAGMTKVLVVLGSDAPIIRKSLKDLSIRTVINPNWEEGMGTSLAFGVTEALKRWPETEAALISTCDQPFITSWHLARLIAEINEGDTNIATSGYGDSYGPPVVFDKKFFQDLMDLKGEKGAKTVVKSHLDEIKIIPCKEGEIDIDTPEDLMGIEC